jgi:hypothetical protein
MMFMPKGPFCQSCGMPLSKDPQGGGTNLDGTISHEYCSKCYKDGAFCNPDMTVEEMTVLVKGKLREMRIPGFLVNYFTKDIPTLRRWKKANS